jgi:NADH-quinone oxidoreductase subunit C
MLPKEIFEILQSEFGEAVIEFNDKQPADPFIQVTAESLFEISHTLRDKEEFLFDYLMCISSLDLFETIGVVYHMYSMKHKHKLVLKIIVPKSEPRVPSVELIWRSADWHEREAFDMMGVVFEGHHNMIRILCPYDWEGYPLRKNYQPPEYYHGMKVS